jgi:hypothetical protein
MKIQQIAEATLPSHLLKHEDVVAFIDKMNTLHNNLKHENLLALEFGYKLCEKGENIQFAIGEYNKLWREASMSEANNVK